MKKFFRISVIVILTLAHVLTVFSPKDAGSQVAAASACSNVSRHDKSCGESQKVGWNT